MFKIIVVVIGFILIYSILSAGLCLGPIGSHNPLHKFTMDNDDWDGPSIKIKTVDDKFFFFILFFIWPFLVIFYYIPKGLFKVLKFLAEFLAWSIAKLFKL